MYILREKKLLFYTKMWYFFSLEIYYLFSKNERQMAVFGFNFDDFCVILPRKK